MGPVFLEISTENKVGRRFRKHKMSEDQKPQNAFQAFILKIDADGNSYIDAQELKILTEVASKKFGKPLTDEQIKEATEAIDKDGDGKFSVKEVSDWLVTAGYLNKTDGLGGFFDDFCKGFKMAMNTVNDVTNKIF